MRFPVVAIVFVLVCAVAQVVRAGITVSSFDTYAQANAYAPLNKSSYFTTDDNQNVSPATCDVSEDWTGTNVGGTDTTWHMLATAHAASTTTVTPNAFSMTGAGSFSYDITTTATFSEPLQHASLYIPGAVSSVGSVFVIDTPSNYTLSVRLNRLGGVYFASFAEGGVILNQSNFSSIPKIVSISGTIAPGQYQIGVTAKDGGPTGLPDGVNHIIRDGSFGDFAFSLQLPEPTVTAISALFVVMAVHRKRKG